MALSKWAFQRIEARVPVLPVEIKGILTFHDGAYERQSPFFVWDVSAKGLGIISSDRLHEGEVLKLTFAKPRVLVAACRVVWCELQANEIEVHEPSYRCGLLAAGSGQDFQAFVDMVEAARKQKK